tara:strand:- start:210 stop:977 length:768 start_codon:yes stop_codon:yes gene_type:complete
MKTKAIIKHITQWMIDYANSSNTKGFVIGISGGIDSAITSVLAAKTKIPLICIEMPIHQNTTQVERGKMHIKWLKQNFSNVSSIEMDLSSVFDKFIENIPEKKKSELSLVNTRARLRMTTLYYFAQAKNHLVLGTGNKVEDFGIGFFTKYGDGAVDISPIADLLKSEVYKIGESLGIQNEILHAAPTDGLWEEDKTDEEQIGATYTELEWAMSYNHKEKINKRQKEVLNIFKKFNCKNQHKMNPTPICKIPKHLK